MQRQTQEGGVYESAIG